MAEFLPLCDLLFNVVSLAAYFCDLIFDILFVYALAQTELFKLLFVQCCCSILITSLITQLLSLKWYLKKKNDTPIKNYEFTTIFIIIIHFFQMGLLWRYAKLLLPVRLTTIKYEVRDLCILRLIHGFLQAAPMLLIQLSLLGDLSSSTIPVPNDLITVSASLSLFSVCWSLASFSKHVQSVERLILTWLGVISQLLWRFGTVTSRILALSAYSATYHSWIFLVLFLHWLCMFFWLLSPKSPFHGQRGRKLWMCSLVAAIYILAYINLQGKPHGRTMLIFYVIMLLENCLLIAAFVAATWTYRPEKWQFVPVLSITLFFIGIFFMLLYYRYFHVKRLMEKPHTSSTQNGGGVFNCRFSGYSGPGNSHGLYRKKKKPTTFIPPPLNGSDNMAPINVPFWRRPIPSSSENEGSSVGSRVNIQQKLQEKKQKQLAELKVIEEEIKQGKLVGPETNDFDDRQPIPRTKKHVEPQLLSLASLNNLANYGVNLNRRPAPRAPQNRTPELLLAPRYLYNNNNNNCDCLGNINNNNNNNNNSNNSNGGQINNLKITENPGNPGNSHHSVGSDLESQVSLPRSYTLPREFKYYRRPRFGRSIQIVASTNSSDGDVDSADEESDNSTPPVNLIRPFRRPFRHETQL